MTNYPEFFSLITGSDHATYSTVILSLKHALGIRFHNATISIFSESRQARECGVVSSGNDVIATCDYEATTPLP